MIIYAIIKYGITNAAVIVFNATITIYMVLKIIDLL